MYAHADITTNDLDILDRPSAANRVAFVLVSGVPTCTAHINANRGRSRVNLRESESQRVRAGRKRDKGTKRQRGREIL